MAGRAVMKETIPWCFSLFCGFDVLERSFLNGKFGGMDFGVYLCAEKQVIWYDGTKGKTLSHRDSDIL